MKVVIVGDIGWRYLYHLGDEAMTEAAIDMLRARGVSDITLVAGEPEVSEDFYGLPCVTRVGFKARWTRRGMDGHLSRVADSLASEIQPGTIFAAIQECDAVIIAGGGNMNSRDVHLLYERVATKRIAEHFGKPLYVTSQTVGPMLEPQDRDLVIEIANYARVFGARESVTTALLREYVERPQDVHHTLDDAVLLTADDKSDAVVGELTHNRPYVVASFTFHPGSTWRDTDAYYQDLANLCTDIANAHDVDVLLAPHAGSLDPDVETRDQEGNAVIAAIAQSDRVKATRMITAREDVALIEHSVLSLSTRYHPTVFAPAVETPAIALISSYYSSVRMRGSLGNVGLQAFALPSTSMHLVRAAVAEAITPSKELSFFLSAAKAGALTFQNRWWDSLVESLKNDAPVKFEATLSPEIYTPQGAWSEENEHNLPVFNRYAQEIDAHEKSVAETTQRIAELEQKLEKTQDALKRFKNRKVVRLIDNTARVFRPNRV